MRGRIRSRSTRTATDWPHGESMFVEGVRLFVVVLGTAAGFWAARSLGAPADGLAGVLGCLLGYVAGGFFGRLLDRALGVVERRVGAPSPARVRRRHARRHRGRALALVLVLPVALLRRPEPRC